MNDVTTSDCALKSRPMLNNHLPLCPWYLKEVDRLDRFPANRMVAVCSCDRKCLRARAEKALPSVRLERSVEEFKSQRAGTYRCKPVTIKVPVLERAKCNETTGLYEWRAALELVPVSCTCTWSDEQ